MALAASGGILAVAACQDGLFTPRDSRFQVQFDVRAVPSAVSSALELVELTTRQGSEQKNDSMTWDAVLEGTPFTVELQKGGEVRFDVVALAGTQRPDGGVALLRGSTQAVVEDGFQVYVQLEDQTPTLVISPEQAPCETDLDLVLRRRATILLCNRGVGALTWTGGGERVVDADAVACPTPGRLCIALDPGAGEIPAGDDELVGLRAVGSGRAVDTVRVEFEEIFDGFVLDTITALVRVEVPSVSIEVATVPTDTEEPPGPFIEVGLPLRVSYKVTNTSVIPLDHVVVTEKDTLPTTERADTLFELDGLEPGEVFDTTLIRPVLVGEQARESTARGTVDGDPVGDSVIHYYVGLLPGVDLETLTNGLEDDQTPGPTVANGSDVEIEYRIRNIGEVPLAALTLVDTTGAVVPVTCAGGGSLPATLAAADSVLCTLHLTATPGQFRQQYTVTGSTPAGQLMADADSSHHVVSGPPPLLVEVRVNGVRASTPPGPSISAGLPVSWSYTVINLGDAVTDLVVSDSVQGTVCVVPTLAAGATLRCPDKHGVAEVGQYHSVATATGTTGDVTIRARPDPTYYLGYVPPDDPEIRVAMLTNGIDADNAPGPDIPVGGSVVWEYRVKNTGNVPLVDVRVYDDHLGLVCSHSGGKLAPGEGFSCYVQGLAQEGQYAALATARGTSPSGDVVEDTDPSHYRGVADGAAAGTVKR